MDSVTELCESIVSAIREINGESGDSDDGRGEN